MKFYKILLIFLLLGITILYIISKNGEDYDKKDSFINQEEEEEDEDKSIDMVDEFKRLRYLLDKYDTEAVKYPNDKDLAIRRTSLEHLLTKIVIYIQQNGDKISVKEAKELF